MEKTIKWILNELKLLNFFQLFNITCFKETFSLLNDYQNNAAKHHLTLNRNIRNTEQNKCGPPDINMGWSTISQNQFVYQMKIKYNKLNRDLTLCPNSKSFAKWIKRTYFNSNTILPKRNDNSNHLLPPIISQVNIDSCQHDII